MRQLEITKCTGHMKGCRKQSTIFLQEYAVLIICMLQCGSGSYRKVNSVVLSPVFIGGIWFHFFKDNGFFGTKCYSPWLLEVRPNLSNANRFLYDLGKTLSLCFIFLIKVCVYIHVFKKCSLCPFCTECQA